jgi:hypothetical protein
VLVLDAKRFDGILLPREDERKTGRPKAAGGFVWLPGGRTRDVYDLGQIRIYLEKNEL